MPLYLFYALRNDGISITWIGAEMANDLAALGYAEEVLKEHPSAARIAVFEGDRPVCEISERRKLEPKGPLQGCSILVLEDQFLLAEDLRSLLHQAGAEVVGPFAEARTAIAATFGQKPTCALVDINLGDGPNFDAAEALLARGVPIVFVTGYDAHGIPNRFSQARHLRKPAKREEILAAVEALCSQGRERRCEPSV